MSINVLFLLPVQAQTALLKKPLCCHDDYCETRISVRTQAQFTKELQIRILHAL